MILNGCSGADQSLLQSADAIMEEKPDSALNILNSIDRNNLSDRDLPYYALLMTQSLVKNDVPLDSDYLISIAYKKYDGAWRGDKGIRSNFYMGEVLFNREQSRDAIKYYLSAYEESKRLHNNYWQAKSAERIADLFFLNYNYDEAIIYRNEAIKLFGIAGKTTNQRYATIDLATDYINNSNYDEAVNLLDSILSICTVESVEDSLLYDYLRRAKIDVLVSLGLLKNLDMEDQRILDLNNSEKAILDANLIELKVNGLSNDLDKTIQKMLSQTNSYEDKTLIYYALYEHAKSTKDINLITEYVDSMLILQNSVAEYIIKESVTMAERDFYSVQSEYRRKKAHVYLLLFISVIIVTTLIFFLMWRLYRIKNIAHKAQLEANVESIITLRANTARISEENLNLNKEMKEQQDVLNNLQDVINSKDIDYQILEKKADEQQKIIEEENKKYLKDAADRISIMNTLFKEKWTTLNNLCEEYFEKGASPKIGGIILRKIE